MSQKNGKKSYQSSFLTLKQTFRTKCEDSFHLLISGSGTHFVVLFCHGFQDPIHTRNFYDPYWMTSTWISQLSIKAASGCRWTYEGILGSRKPAYSRIHYCQKRLRNPRHLKCGQTDFQGIVIWKTEAEPEWTVQAAETFIERCFATASFFFLKIRQQSDSNTLLSPWIKQWHILWNHTSYSVVCEIYKKEGKQ